MNLLKFFGGILTLTFGGWFFLYLLKNPIDTEQDVNKAMIQGYISAIAAIILGIILIFNGLNNL